MKKKVFSAILLAGALAVSPSGGGLLSAVASASSNNTVSSNNTAKPGNPANPDGTVSTTVAAESNPYEVWDDLERQISNAEGGTVIEVKGLDTLSNGVMKALLKKGDVSLTLKYAYQGVDYVVTISAGTAEDNEIPWYGPLYLASHFGNGVVVKGGYSVKSGDTMTRIAVANGMTLAQLAAKNPQIQDLNRISVGQTINLK